MPKLRLEVRRLCSSKDRLKRRLTLQLRLKRRLLDCHLQLGYRSRQRSLHLRRLRNRLRNRLLRWFRSHDSRIGELVFRRVRHPLRLLGPQLLPTQLRNQPPPWISSAVGLLQSQLNGFKDELLNPKDGLHWLLRVDDNRHRRS